MNCALFCAGALETLTGVDLGAAFRGKIRDEQSAARAIRRAGAADLEALADQIAARHGWARIPVTMAGRGDPVLIETVIGPALGVVDFNGTEALTASPSGVLRVPLSACSGAWRVP